MDRLPKLTTERLVLLVPTSQDAERLAAYLADNREHLAPWEPTRPQEYYAPEFWRAALPELVDEALAERSVTLLLAARTRPDGPVLGRCALSNIVRGPFQAAHLGFSLAASAVGGGLMSEALAAVIRYAFDDLRLHRLMANYMPRNARSARVLGRLGFCEEGRARDYLLIDGAWRDHVLTSLVNPRSTPA